jgi:hypothetical protein
LLFQNLVPYDRVILRLQILNHTTSTVEKTQKLQHQLVHDQRTIIQGKIHIHITKKKTNYIIISSMLAKNNREACILISFKLAKMFNINSHCQINPSTEAIIFSSHCCQIKPSSKNNYLGTNTNAYNKNNKKTNYIPKDDSPLSDNLLSKLAKNKQEV